MATLADVARLAGVSLGTASRVLNNKMATPLRPATIARIRQAAAELDYRPHPLARALATGRTHTLGLWYGNTTDPHFLRMLESVEVRARELGYHILISSDANSLLEGGRVDGALMVELPGNLTHLSFREVRAAVFVSPAREAPPNCIVWSDYEGAYLATRYLLNLGHRHIGGIFGNDDPTAPPRDRVLGFRKAVEEAKANSREFYGTLGTDQMENGYILAQQLLREWPQATAIFARNDFLALGVLQALVDAGIRVPEQMSVIGYNDTVLARFPRLTSVHTPFAEAGVMALERLVRAIDNGETPFPGICLPVTLTERSSCAPPRRERG